MMDGQSLHFGWDDVYDFLLTLNGTLAAVEEEHFMGVFNNRALIIAVLTEPPWPISHGKYWVSGVYLMDTLKLEHHGKDLVKASSVFARLCQTERA
jgi:hypothetical protein